jgi:plastocyanin
VYAQNRPAVSSSVELRLHILSSLPGKHRAVPAVIWLEPLAATPALAFPAHGHYILLQKNRTFTPHLQVIPAGSVVEFPNEDPFFHNVFSLFEGKRFDLGLYEAGSSKAVTFSRVGVSYIFCNIHPEMSAIVIALNTPLYAEADTEDSVLLRGIPPGDYKLHVWIEGVPRSFLDGLSRPVHFSDHAVDLGVIKAPIAGGRTAPHNNMYGQEYAPDAQSPYSSH